MISVLVTLECFKKICILDLSYKVLNMLKGSYNDSKLKTLLTKKDKKCIYLKNQSTESTERQSHESLNL